jgi:hypothetical protein
VAPDGARLSVLLTNITLASRTGTEINVRDVARELARRGHRPVVYSPDPGEMAEEIRASSLPVVSDLAAVAARPDVIHGHHHAETMAALLRFPGVPALFFVHDYRAWHDVPPLFPRIRRYVAVDETVRDRIVLEHGIPEARTRRLLNAVDMERFPRRGPLPERPRRALVYSRTVTEAGAMGEIRRACDRFGIEVDGQGGGVGPVVTQPEALLGRYDLVFAKARCALEALAVGAAVVLCDEAGMGELVTARNLDAMRALNFGRRALRLPVRADRLVEEVTRYDAADANSVTARIRAEAGIRESVDALLAIYAEAIAEEKGSPSDPGEEMRALGRYLEEWGPRFEESAFWQERAEFPGRRRALADHRRGRANEHARLEAERPALVAEREALRVLTDELHRELEMSRAGRDAAEEQAAAERERSARIEEGARRRDQEAVTRESEIVRLRCEIAGLVEEIARLQRHLDAVTSSATWRLRERVLRAARKLRAERAIAGVLRWVT